MTPEDMRFEIESVFASVLGTKKPSVKTGQALPAGLTPLSWNLTIPAAAEGLTATEFRVQFGDHAGEELAMVGLSHGCTQFAKLTVQDRGAVEVKSMGGRGIPRKRPRAFVVHAMGWGQKAEPEYEHRSVWPHAMGKDVPAASKGEPQ